MKRGQTAPDPPILREKKLGSTPTSVQARPVDHVLRSAGSLLRRRPDPRARSAHDATGAAMAVDARGAAPAVGRRRADGERWPEEQRAGDPLHASPFLACRPAGSGSGTECRARPREWRARPRVLAIAAAWFTRTDDGRRRQRASSAQLRARPRSHQGPVSTLQVSSSPAGASQCPSALQRPSAHAASSRHTSPMLRTRSQCSPRHRSGGGHSKVSGMQRHERSASAHNGNGRRLDGGSPAHAPSATRSMPVAASHRATPMATEEAGFVPGRRLRPRGLEPRPATQPPQRWPSEASELRYSRAGAADRVVSCTRAPRSAGPPTPVSYPSNRPLQ